MRVLVVFYVVLLIVVSMMLSECVDGWMCAVVDHASCSMYLMGVVYACVCCDRSVVALI